MVLSNGESLRSELSLPRTSPSGNVDDVVSERTPVSDKFKRKVETKTILTIKDFPLKITDVDEAKPVAVNGDIGLVSQSHEHVSDQLSNFPLTASFDNKAKPELVNGDIGLLSKSREDFSKESIASEEATEDDLAPAQKTDKKKKARHVSLDPHAVLLDAAVEGELDLVKQLIREVDNPSKPNSDGITALHNAVCACHDQVVYFLVQYGADINSPDSHGWTPLHCAAANNATEMARFLVEHGACVFAATSLEKKTPLQCCERGLPGYFNCTRYLNDVQQNFGLINEGRVYALYNYTADEQDELSFVCGEELLVLKRGVCDREGMVVGPEQGRGDWVHTKKFTRVTHQNFARSVTRTENMAMTLVRPKLLGPIITIKSKFDPVYG
ncbi:hypothetical protein OS493_022565 [Desmophyllum pertusum]|uniref:Uncharacterized protein n=1 Tax=Desmophyllum pertusum TaxID=174260 RepID=A0A9W9ZBL1_9CNID|nr:hypothetical protein OS493_022565 [Desmophyllum pertusum]